MKPKVKNIMKAQVNFSIDEFKKKDLKKMSYKDLQRQLDRFYSLSFPDKKHMIAIETIHRRLEENLKGLRKKHKLKENIEKMQKLDKKLCAYEAAKRELAKGYMIQELRGFIIENK